MSSSTVSYLIFPWMSAHVSVTAPFSHFPKKSKEMWEDFCTAPYLLYIFTNCPTVNYNTHNNCKMMWYIDYNLTCNEGKCMRFDDEWCQSWSKQLCFDWLFPFHTCIHCVTCIYSMMGCAPLAQTGNGTRLKSIKAWLWDVMDNYTLQTNMFVQRWR